MNTCQFCFSFGNTTVLCMEAETCGIQNCYLPFMHKHNVCNRCKNINTKNNKIAKIN